MTKNFIYRIEFLFLIEVLLPNVSKLLKIPEFSRFLKNFCSKYQVFPGFFLLKFQISIFPGFKVKWQPCIYKTLTNSINSKLKQYKASVQFKIKGKTNVCQHWFFKKTTLLKFFKLLKFHYSYPEQFQCVKILLLKQLNVIIAF